MQAIESQYFPLHLLYIPLLFATGVKIPEETLEEYYHLESQYEIVRDISIFVNQRQKKSPFTVQTSCKVVLKPKPIYKMIPSF